MAAGLNQDGSILFLSCDLQNSTQFKQSHTDGMDRDVPRLLYRVPVAVGDRDSGLVPESARPPVAMEGGRR
jgi:hypothetical protein